MLSQLDGLGIYALSGGTLVERELAAYDVAFTLLEELLAEIRRDAFPQTSEGEALALYESLVGLGLRRGLTVEARRALILYRLSIAPMDFTLEGMTRSLKAAGLDAEVAEGSPEERLIIRSNVFLDEFEDLDAVKERISQMLPAHLDWEFDTGYLTWDGLEAADVDWDGWDALNFTWDEFDVDGHNIFAVQ
jgi:hypothetical protein